MEFIGQFLVGMLLMFTGGYIAVRIWWFCTKWFWIKLVKLAEKLKIKKGSWQEGVFISAVVAPPLLGSIYGFIYIFIKVVRKIGF